MLIVIPFRKSQLLFQEVVGVSLYEVVNIIDHPIHLFECLVCHQFGDIEVFCSLCITLQSGTLMHVEQGGDLRAWHVSQDL